MAVLEAKMEEVQVGLLLYNWLQMCQQAPTAR